MTPDLVKRMGGRLIQIQKFRAGHVGAEGVGMQEKGRDDPETRAAEHSLSYKEVLHKIYIFKSLKIGHGGSK